MSYLTTTTAQSRAQALLDYVKYSSLRVVTNKDDQRLQG